MISISNGGLSDVSNKRPLENGYTPKYKPRKVSATRDFPPGCGPNAVPTNLKLKENVSSGAAVVEVNGGKNSEIVDAVLNNGVGIPETTNPREVEGVGNPEITNRMEVEWAKTAELPNDVKLNGLKESGKENFVESIGIKNSNVQVELPSHEAVNSPMDADIGKSLDALVEKMTAFADDMIVEIGPVEIQLQNEVEGQTHEVVTTSIQGERTESLDALVGQVTVDSISIDVEKLTPETKVIGVDFLNNMKSESSRGTKAEGHTILKELNVEAKSVLEPVASVDGVILPGRSQSLSSLSGSIKPEISIRPKDKYRRRRVSAVRDFPPNCGRNISLPAEVKKKKVTSGNDCLNRFKKVEVQPEATVLRNGSEEGASGDMLMTSQKEGLDGVERDHVKTETTEKFNYGSGRVPRAENLAGNYKTIPSREMREATVEVGHLGSKECNVGPKNSNIEKTEARRTVPGSGTMSKALHDNSIGNAGGPVRKETIVHSPDSNDKVRSAHSDFSSGNELHREVVNALMAASCCPWRKGKGALNNSDGGTSARKKRERNRKQKSKTVALDNDTKADISGGTSKKKTVFPDSSDAYRSPVSPIFMGDGIRVVYDECPAEVTPVSVTPVSMFNPALDCSDEDTAGPVGNEIVVYSPEERDKMTPCSADEVDREVVSGLMAASCGRKARKLNISRQKKSKVVAKKSNPSGKFSAGPSKKSKKVPVANDEDERHSALMLADKDGFDTPISHKPQDFDVRLPPLGPNNSSHGDVRNRVRETLRLFHAICRKLLQREEANSVPDEEGKPNKCEKIIRIDLHTAKIIKERGKEVNTEKQYLGSVPGVEVGDEFQYRVELAVVGIHRLLQGGIDWMKINKVPVATSIVASGGYADDMENADVLIYSGQGGNVIGKKKEAEDQKLERGNLALVNSVKAGTPVRVVRGWKETKLVDPLDSRPKIVTTYVYDGLYTVKNYWTETGPHGKNVFKFELRRNPGQPELAWKELKKSSKFKTRPGVCVADISGGTEPFPICAVNIIDEQKPPTFNYTSKMMYPDWYHPIPPAGCDCVGRCADSKKCSCAVRNGGEIPYNRNGAIVEVKPLVYECGPSCKCPPSCYNRATQRGLKFKLEIFKTESRGWGVRSITSIPSGSFICEYAGELLEDTEAEQRIGNDEYLFDIGQNYNDFSLNTEEPTLVEFTEGGYTIDAAQYGNIGRFINHSCSPNLYAQNVIYDHDDPRLPHVMLFAAENIPPLQELTYHYNYTVDQVRDSDGNIKVKKCYCGTAECTGRMY
ncbi:hypothetical protein ACJIZ3_001540 [Penstemon smallii]|uniref:Uncharacterized protein n=1 Tax=Penstemon smallii TaxID=265156 RepID=A0ABD3U4Z5_9LAMI